MKNVGPSSQKHRSDRVRRLGRGRILSKVPEESPMNTPSTQQFSQILYGTSVRTLPREAAACERHIWVVQASCERTIHEAL